MNGSQSVARITGAFAHELCNPLQGVQSLIEVVGRETDHESGLSGKLERIEAGIHRLASVLKIFRVAYENLPRPADQITAEDLIEQLAAAFRQERIHTTIRTSVKDNTVIQALTPELTALMSYAMRDPDAASIDTDVSLTETDDGVILKCVRAGDEPFIGPWFNAAESADVVGTPVLIDEIVRMGGGQALFGFDHAGLKAVKIKLTTHGMNMKRK